MRWTDKYNLQEIQKGNGSKMLTFPASRGWPEGSHAVAELLLQQQLRGYAMAANERVSESGC